MSDIYRQPCRQALAPDPREREASRESRAEGVARPVLPRAGDFGDVSPDGRAMARLTVATAAERFADWTLGLELEDVPADVIAAAKLHLLDALGCGLAASA